ncbi:MAG: hypothetical protein Kow00117_10920 [Phototrophicales bacterium]
MLRLLMGIISVVFLCIIGLMMVMMQILAPHLPYQGHEIAFLALIDRNWHIVRFDLSRNAYYVIEPQQSIAPSTLDWSPDGTQLAVTSGYSGRRILLVNLADGTVKQLPGWGEGRDYLPKWSPDGEKIAFFSGIGSDPRETQSPVLVIVLDVNNYDTQLLAAGAMSLDWSPDGASLLYQTEMNNWAIYHLASEQQTTVQVDVSAGDLAWSPDGEYVAFWQAGRTTSIGVVSLTTGDIVTLARHATYNYFNPDWSPDGRRLLVMAADTQRGVTEIHVIDDQGHIRQRVTQFDHMAYPRWRP